MTRPSHESLSHELLLLIVTSFFGFAIDVLLGEFFTLGLHRLLALLDAPLPLQLARCRLLLRISRVDAANRCQNLRSTGCCAELRAHVCNVGLARTALLKVTRKLWGWGRWWGKR